MCVERRTTLGPRGGRSRTRTVSEHYDFSRKSTKAFREFTNILCSVDTKFNSSVVACALLQKVTYKKKKQIGTNNGRLRRHAACNASREKRSEKRSHRRRKNSFMYRCMRLSLIVMKNTFNPFRARDPRVEYTRPAALSALSARLKAGQETSALPSCGPGEFEVS